MAKKTFYITTTLPYVNADPHIGFALEIVQADIVARYKRMLGLDVFFNTGTDEHGLKIFQKAEEAGISPQEYANEYAEKFRGLKEKLQISDINFIRTTDEHHKKAAQTFWKKCLDAGYIYKKNYKIKYCVGCELEKTDSELVNGHCILHPNLEIQIIDEENYFFKFSAFQEKLEKLYKDKPEFVVPDVRFNEIKAFVDRGLEDFSISRLKEKMSWGVPVPGDDTQVMYVWFDALVNYISAIGWPEDLKKFEMYWPVVQVAGKDNLRQQSAMWQAMLMAAELPPSEQIVIHGFITSNGQKMSKSLGNVINPYDIVSEYGTDALRYFLAREIHPFEDSDFTMERFKEAYNSGLANGIGNLASRIIKMATTYEITDIDYISDAEILKNSNVQGHYTKALNEYAFNKAADTIWQRIQLLDEQIQDTEPFKLIKTDKEQALQIVRGLVQELWIISTLLMPFMPETALKIKTAIQEKKMIEPLFLRK